MTNPGLQIKSSAVPATVKGVVQRATTSADKILHYNATTGQFVYVA